VAFNKQDIKVGIIWRLVEVVGAEFFAFSHSHPASRT